MVTRRTVVRQVALGVDDRRAVGGALRAGSRPQVPRWCPSVLVPCSFLISSPETTTAAPFGAAVLMCQSVGFWSDVRPIAGAAPRLHGDDGDVILLVPPIGESVLFAVPFQTCNQIRTGLDLGRCGSREGEVRRFKGGDVCGHVTVIQPMRAG